MKKKNCCLSILCLNNLTELSSKKCPKFKISWATLNFFNLRIQHNISYQSLKFTLYTLFYFVSRFASYIFKCSYRIYFWTEISFSYCLYKSIFYLLQNPFVFADISYISIIISELFIIQLFDRNLNFQSLYCL